MAALKAFVSTGLALLMASAALAQTAPAPTTAPPADRGLVYLVDAERAQAIAAANAALNGLATIEARFFQIGWDGASSQGKVVMARPGKVRFAYDAPTKLLIVADGATVAIEDGALKTVDRAPLRSTPLWFVLKKEIDLGRDATITEVRREDGLLFITVQDRSGEAQGALTLVFDGAPLALTQWVVRDPQGYVTRVALSDVTALDKVDPRLFVVNDENDPTDRRR